MNGSGYKMQGPPGLEIAATISPGEGLRVVAGWVLPSGGRAWHDMLGINHARRAVKRTRLQYARPRLGL